MSSKSDRDNRANQLNPNNSAYTSSRSGNGPFDDDEAYDESRPYRLTPPIPRLPEWKVEKYFLVILAYDGQITRLRFTTKTSYGYGAGGRHIALSVWEDQVGFVETVCPLGVAFAKIFGPDRQSLPKLIWNHPTLRGRDLLNAKAGPFITQQDIDRANAWYGGIKALGDALDTAFETDPAVGSVDLGEFERDVEYDPNRHLSVSIPGI